MAAMLLQHLRALQSQGAATAYHDAFDLIEIAQNLLIVGDGPQGRHARELCAGAGELPGARALREQEFLKVQLLTVVQLDGVLPGVDGFHATRDETDVIFLVKRGWPGPEFFFGHVSGKIIFERRTIIHGQWIIGHNRDRRL